MDSVRQNETSRISPDWYVMMLIGLLIFEAFVVMATATQSCEAQQHPLQACRAHPPNDEHGRVEKADGLHLRSGGV